ncbi:hypothetical protein J1N09_15260 [Aureitalea sp. L0-47]|uniref:hypothetical protein n=1 Tax=Aureitalea sp. L0-47 TaxID=2816962 RepID=UPI0022371A66|nr:hypothetical protein [Aureitalea sp. L0-47]MCW5521202.1 hypothetical protein [Aureitalea sp. L0-47]
MKRSYFFYVLSITLLIGFLQESVAQVGVNTGASIATGAAFEVRSTDKGILLPRVALTGSDDNTTITPAPSTGLFVYNTTKAGSGSTMVEPGFYYFDGSVWRRLFNEGYTLQYDQTAEVRATKNNCNCYNTNYVDITGLDTGNISIPFSGTYQIITKVYMTAGDNLMTNSDGAVQGSMSLWMDTNNSGTFTKISEQYLTSSSKRINGSNYNYLGQAGTIVYNVDLDATNTYSFKVRGREWYQGNSNNSNTASWFGKNTSGYAGANGVNDAQYGEMTITLVNQN